MAVGNNPVLGVVAFASGPDALVLGTRNLEVVMPMHSNLDHACGTSATTCLERVEFLAKTLEEACGEDRTCLRRWDWFLHRWFHIGCPAFGHTAVCNLGPQCRIRRESLRELRCPLCKCSKHCFRRRIC